MARILLTANTDWYLYNFRLALAKHLRAEGHHVTLASPTGPYIQAFDREGFDWEVWEVGRQSVALSGELRAVRTLNRILKRIRPDVIHNHTIKAVLYGSLAGRWANIPVIINSITGRGYVFLSETHRARRLRRMVLPVYKVALHGSNVGVIFENPTDQEYFVSHKLAPASQTWLIEGVGVDPEHFSPGPAPSGTPLVILPTRMLWDKGVGVLVEAAQLLKPRLAVRVVLAGEPDPGNPASIPIEKLQEWQVAGLVEWWGWQSDMPAIYRQSHIVTLPTMYGEGVPTVLLEGAACGLPLVATDIPGCRQIVQSGKNGFLVPPGNAVALAEVLERLLQDATLRGRMGAASRQIVLDRFTHASINAATLAVYQKLLHKRPIKPA